MLATIGEGVFQVQVTRGGSFVGSSAARPGEAAKNPCGPNAVHDFVSQLPSINLGNYKYIDKVYFRLSATCKNERYKQMSLR